MIIINLKYLILFKYKINRNYDISFNNNIF